MTTEPDIDAEKQKLLRHLVTFDARIRYPAPYVAFAGKPSSQIFENGWHYDGLGYRNDVTVGPRGRAEAARVFIVGDSTLVDGLDTADTVPGRVQTVLRQSLGAGAHVYNFGAISNCLNQAIMLITTKLIDLEPDAIVILAGGTDIFQPWTFDPRPGQPYNQFAIEAIHDDLFSQGTDTRAASIVDQRAMLEILFSRLRNLRLVTCWKEAAWEWEVVRNFELSVDRIGRLSTGIGIPIHLVLQPMVVRKPALSEEERSFATLEFLEYLDRQYTRLKAVVGNYERKFGRRKFFTVHDLSDLFFDHTDSVFTDIVHYNAGGRQRMAEELVSLLNIVRPGAA
ncbi:SGNH/GDSL hydrolase family protein [Methylobacterium sp. J-026]|uniref:SGNH/GDSL hydrolase family protein n=1 Tax=Methylobacterium sp. J-026 TaxID=2836624 RepID=UPI001FBB6D7E|nr:SGNH/GDSL hydrolase family protein [Methylobacterium sp. J-026]MCJ2137471.1 SGNH/GDSL hydrolase family protein [Methylobacterium sp. J-026]